MEQGRQDFTSDNNNDMESGGRGRSGDEINNDFQGSGRGGAQNWTGNNKSTTTGGFTGFESQDSGATGFEGGRRPGGDQFDDPTNTGDLNTNTSGGPNYGSSTGGGRQSGQGSLNSDDPSSYGSGAGRDHTSDNFDSGNNRSTNRTGAPRTGAAAATGSSAVSTGGVGASGWNGDDQSGAGIQNEGTPSFGDKLKGTMEQIGGSIKRDPALKEQGKMRKEGEFSEGNNNY